MVRPYVSVTWRICSDFEVLRAGEDRPRRLSLLPVRIGEIGRVCRRVQRALPGLVGGMPGVAFTPPFGQPAQVPDLEVGRVDPGGCVPALGKLAGDGGKEVG